MLREIFGPSRDDLGVAGLSGLEITGLVIVLIGAGLLVWMGPELVRYIKIKMM